MELVMNISAKHNRSENTASTRVRIEALEQRLFFAAAPLLVHSISNLIHARLGPPAVSAGGLVIVASGGIPLTPPAFATMELYDPNTGKWELAPFPRPDSNIMAGSLGNLALFTPGDSLIDSKSPGYLDVYDTKGKTWSIIKSTFNPFNASINAVGNSIIVAKNKTANVFSGNHLHRQSSKIPLPIASLGTVVCGNVYYSVQNSELLEKYNSATGRWSTIQLPQEFVANMDSVYGAIGSNLIFASVHGLHPNTAIIYNTVTQTWNELLIPDQQTAPSTITAIGNKVIFTFESESAPNVHIYDFSNQKWSADTLSDSTQRAGISVTTLNNQAFLVGGHFSAIGLTGNVDIFTDTTPVPVLSGGLNGTAGHRVTVQIFNTGDAPLASGAVVKIYATQVRGVIDGTSTLIGNQTLAQPLAATANKTLGIRTVIPGSVAGGTYYLTAAVDDGSMITPIAASDATFMVRAKKAAPSLARRFSGAVTGLFRRS